MSENFVSEPMTLEHGTRMNPTMIQSDSLTTNALMGSLGAFDSTSALQQLPISDTQQDALMNIHASQEMFISNEPVGNFEPMSNNLGAQHVVVPTNWKMEQMKAFQVNQGQQKLSLPIKRKASPDKFTSNDQAMQKLSASTKKTALARSQPKSSVPSVLSVPNKISALAGSISNLPRSANPSRKQVQSEIGLNRSQLHPQKNRNEQPAKAHFESFGSIRAKLRESLAAALALVSQQQENLSKAEKNGQTELGSKEQRQHVPTNSMQKSTNASQQDNGKAADTLAPTVSQSQEECMDAKNVSEGINSTVVPWKFVGQEFQSNPVLPYEDASFNDNFFAKDELLLGNGLAWAMDLDVNAPGMKEAHPADKPNLMTQEDVCSGKKEPKHSCPEPEPTLPSPQSVASKIELELFKLFGGVNKKYKEKGRSLLFNLKDKSNPELRERVMAGEISPERLCSMTAEELASKELSDWRIAKAEELAQMKVLPDTEVDLRRLVKKTHKGEFQVEVFETEVSAPVDGLVGGSSIVQDRSEVKGNEAKSSSNAERAHKLNESKGKVDTVGVKRGAEDSDGQCRFTIPSESGDIMQGLMVDDMKDLPPIVSLDEFMESLDKEPPFENLSGDSENSTLASEKANSDAGSELKSSERASKVLTETLVRKAKEVGSKGIKPSGNVKPIPSRKEYVWDGLLQLNIASMANFVGIYKSGEKTSTKEWPRFFEIKGRVRLEAFEKFIHELPNSRSRAIMVVHFALDVGCTDKDQTNLQELVDSYLADQRLGFGEPAPGTEVYFLPPGATTLEMLNKQLPKNYTEMLNAIESGLIGVVVWRKAQLPTPTISPKSSSHHKDNKSRRQQHFHLPTAANLRPQDENMISNVNFASRDVAPTPSVLSRSLPNNNNNDDDDDDDVPPGFGPQGSNRDDDDLPEFNFSSSGPTNLVSHQKILERLPSPTPPHSVEQMRKLIQKYGKPENTNTAPSGGGIVLQPWNDDDDDDIPEWQPQQRIPLAQPSLVPHVGNCQVTPLAKPLQLLQPPMVVPMGSQNVGPWQPQGGGGWLAGGAVSRGGHHQQGVPGSAAGQTGRQWIPDGSARPRNNRGY